MLFKENDLQNLLGNEAAEDDPIAHLKQFFVKTDLYTQMITDLPLRVIVGSKGVGKSALFKIAIHEEANQNRLTLLIKPNDILNIRTESNNFLQLIQDWKTGISTVIIQKIINNFGLPKNDSFNSIYHPNQNISNSDISREILLKNFLKHQKISIYLDDLDRGWQGTLQDIHRIAALLSALRDLANENDGLFFRVSLRADLYFAIRTEDESTDKIEGSVIRFQWQPDDILRMLAKRILNIQSQPVSDTELLQMPMEQLHECLGMLIDPQTENASHWTMVQTTNLLLTLIRSQPRDLIKLMLMAGRDARRCHHTKIHLQNIFNVLKVYSQARLQDLINEYKIELPDIRSLLFHILDNLQLKDQSKPVRFDLDELKDSVASFMTHYPLSFQYGSALNISNLLCFLHRINFLVAVEVGPNSVRRISFEESLFLSEQLPSGYLWEIHPAYRWAFYDGDAASLCPSILLNPLNPTLGL